MEDPAVGHEVDGYRIDALLGRGGMGVVYKAEDVALSRPVALKRIAPGLVRSASFMRRFRAEAQALAQLDSPYITRIYALRPTDLGLLIVMEYVAGETLGEALQRGPMEVATALSSLKQMLRALEDAHGAGLIHRDIKPSNVLLTPEGGVKVTDFGLAQALQRDPQATLTQGTAGTLNYMSPEQVQGKTNLGPSTDLFSLGMTTYEMLAGRLPFDRDASEFAKMRAIVEESFSPPRRFCREVPAGLSQVVMKALEKDPDQRYQSARAMRKALDEVEAGQMKAAPAKRGSRSSSSPQAKTGASAAGADVAGSWARRAWTGGLLSVLFLALIGGGYWIWRSAPPPPPPVRLSVETTPSGAGVYLGGAHVGATPLAGRTVEEGTLRMRLEKPGYAPVDTLLQAERGQALTLDVVLSAAPPPPPSPAHITVETTPSGAEVFLNEQPVGTTPLRTYAVEEGSLRVRLQKPERLPVDTLLQVEGGQSLTLEAALPAPDPSPPPPLAHLTVKSAPLGAVVFLNEQPVGTTPLREHAVRGGTLRMRLEKPGYAPVDTVLQSDHGESLAVNVRMSEQSPAPKRNASLTVRVEPTGSVEWNGVRHARQGTFEMQPGWQRIQLHHPEHETVEEQVELAPGQSKELTYYFERTVHVKTDGPSGQVYLDDRRTNTSTPHTLRLGPGRYDIRVSVPGHTVSEGEIIAYWPGREKLADFSGGNTKMIFVRPDFREMAYELLFETQKE